MDNKALVEIKKTRPSIGQKVAVGLAAASPLLANAAIDVAPVTTLVGEAVVAAGVIGLAFLGFKAGMALFKSLRSAA